MDPDNGTMSIDWKSIDGGWYYFNASGHRQTGWVTVGSKYYYLDPANDGRMVTGTTKTIDGVSYTFDSNGVYQSSGGGTPNTSTNNTTPSGGPGGSGTSTGSGSPGGSSTSGNAPGSGSNSNSPGSGSNSSPSGSSNSNGTLQPGLTTGPG